LAHPVTDIVTDADPVAGSVADPEAEAEFDH
jgi:hypothetical protein